MIKLHELHEQILKNSSLDEAQNQKIIKNRFSKIPNKLSLVYEKFKLKEKRVLEVGCNYGHVLLHCKEGSMGVDINKRAIRFINDMGMKGVILDVDNNDLREIPDNYFDIIYIADTLEHLESPHRLLVNLRDKLKKDGKILVYIHILPKYKIFQYITRYKVKGLWSLTHYFQYNFNTFQYLLECSGFKLDNYFISGCSNYKVSKFFTIFLKNFF